MSRFSDRLYQSAQAIWDRCHEHPFLTELSKDPRVRVVGRFAAASHPRIVYPAARVADSSHPDAAAFVAWLRSPAAQAVFRRHGFLPPR